MYSIFKIIDGVECIAHTDAKGNGRLIMGDQIVAIFHAGASITPLGKQYMAAGWKVVPRTDKRCYNQKGGFVGSPRLVEYLDHFPGNFWKGNDFSNYENGRHILPEKLESIFQTIKNS
jgi:hypothetical protein